ncbi:uncharacterized protein BX663DRAFT_528004 [Cokeromyces recurvatus]|uniref:uncharacterized protein n=1 Tax=Cokeromyces recurvatus TaxID=90255 RepID=UPI002220337D|nr:uncharacterized protein BX663DRAFT_528004 [Cokeromyces recurvatus]KAI7897536.1 hypothetical protein BX663DRAFT_528004 [Cokeromyces recurvatus]
MPYNTRSRTATSGLDNNLNGGNQQQDFYDDINQQNNSYPSQNTELSNGYDGDLSTNSASYNYGVGQNPSYDQAQHGDQYSGQHDTSLDQPTGQMQFSSDQQYGTQYGDQNQQVYDQQQQGDESLADKIENMLERLAGKFSGGHNNPSGGSNDNGRTF